MRRLGEREVRRMLKNLGSWRLAGRRIVRVVRYEGFMPGVELLNEIAKLVEEMDHHPDVTVSYGRMRSLSLFPPFKTAMKKGLIFD